MYEKDSNDYVDGRLRGTIVRDKKNDLFFIDFVDGNFKVRGHYIKGDLGAALDLDDLILNSPPLGYTNYDGVAWYIGRWPRRMDWRQGLRRDNMFVIKLVGNLRNYNFQDYVPLFVPLKKKYPTYSEALERVEDIYESCAFSPHFAVDNNNKIYYKNQVNVGKDKNGVPVLDRKFEYLNELLHEETNAT